MIDRRWIAVPIVAIVILLLVGTVLAYLNINAIRTSYLDVTEENVPQLLNLEQSRIAMSTIIREGLSASLGLDEATLSGAENEGAIEVELDELEEAVADFEQSLGEYQASVETLDEEDEESYVVDIAAQGQTLIGLVNVLIEKKQSGGCGR